MKVVHQRTLGTSKLCHARPGDLVQLVNDQPHIISPVLLVTAEDVPSIWPSEGLYKAKSVRLFDISDGMWYPSQSLSSRAIIYRNAEVSVGPPDTCTYA